MNPYTLPLDNMNVIHIPHRFIKPVEENVENPCGEEHFITISLHAAESFLVLNTGLSRVQSWAGGCYLYKVRVRPRGLL